VKFLKVYFILTQLSHGSPGSFYRPLEISKNLNLLNIQSTLYTPFQENNISSSDVSIKQFFQSNRLIGSTIGYDFFRKFIYNKIISNFIPYDKLLKSLSEKIYQSMEKTFTDKPDILQAEQEVAALASIKYSKKYCIPLVVDVHNIWPEELVADGYIKKNSTVFKNLMKIEKFIFENADGIICVNEFMKNYLIEYFDTNPSKIIIIPPCGDILFNIKQEITERQFNEPRVIYSGLVNKREKVSLFVNSIPFLKKYEKNIETIISEKGELINEIKKLSKSLNTNTKFCWFESRDDLRTLLKTCHLGILPSANNIPRKLGTPLKLLEYISNGLPIVANDVGSWCSIISDNKIGILTDDDPKNFADAIVRIISDKKLFFSMQKNIVNLINSELNWKSQVSNKLIPMYEKIS